MANNKPKKKSKEQVYKELQGQGASPNSSGAFAPIRTQLQEQVESQYPVNYKSMPEYYDILKKLANDMQLDKVTFSGRGGYYELPEYMYKGENYDIDELPKQSNPNSLTSFLGRFDPFKQEVPLTEKERMNAPVKYGPERFAPNEFGQTLVGLGKIKDFRTGREGGRDMYEDKNIRFRFPTSEDSRIVNSAYLDVNPQTLDEMINAPGTGAIRFKAVQDQLKKAKQRQDILNSVKDKVEDDEVEELLKNR
jgi:hypothetical protein